MRQPARQQEAVKTSRKMVPMASEEQVACTHRLEPRLGQQVGRLSESPQQQLAALLAASTLTQEPSVQQQRGCARARASVQLPVGQIPFKRTFWLTACIRYAAALAAFPVNPLPGKVCSAAQPHHEYTSYVTALATSQHAGLTWN